MQQENGNVFLIADTHLGHQNIISYADRPFQTLDEMNHTMIQNWNQVVTPNDTVFMLGDFAFGSPEKIHYWASQLQGHKILIMGNHDREMPREIFRNSVFDEVIDYPIIYQEWFILSHEPVYLNRAMPYANIFGHVHDNPMYQTCTQQSFCVSVERINYTPILWQDMIAQMQASPKTRKEVEK